MPEILKYGSDVDPDKKSPKPNLSKFFTKSVWDWFRVQDKFTKTYVIAFLLIAISTPFVVGQYLNYSQNAQQAVSQEVSFVNPIEGDIVKVNSQISIIADTSDKTKKGRVEFYVNENLLCTVNEPPYVCDWQIPDGSGTTYSLSLRTFDSSNTPITENITVTSE